LPAAPTATIASFGVTTPQFRRYDASVTLSGGTDVDFLEADEADRVTITGAVNLRPTERLRVNATYTSTSYRRKTTGQQSSAQRVPRLKLEYQVARPIFVRFVSQYQSISRTPLFDVQSGSLIYLQTSPGVYVPSSDFAANTWRSDVLFSYRPNPGTVVFAGYGNTFQESEVGSTFLGRRRTDDAFFVKLSYLFRVD
jgi:hypothetical protein